MPRRERQPRRLVISIRDLPGFDDVHDVPEEELASDPGASSAERIDPSAESPDPLLDPPVTVNVVRITVAGGAGAPPPSPRRSWWKRTAALVGAGVGFLATLAGVVSFLFGPFAARDIDELTVVVSRATASRGLFQATLVFSNTGTRPQNILETRLRYEYADGLEEGREARSPSHPAFTVPARDSRIERLAIPYETPELGGLSDDSAERLGSYQLVLEFVVIDADGGRHVAGHDPFTIDVRTGAATFPPGYDAERPIPLL